METEKKFTLSQMIESSPALRSSTVAYSDTFSLTIGGVLNIADDLTKKDCELILQKNILRQIQIGAIIGHNSLKLINETLLPSRQNISLRMEITSTKTLELLSKLPNLKNLNAYLENGDDLKKINQYLNLETLAIGGPKVSLKPVLEQKILKELFIYIDKPMDIENIGQMNWIDKLTFSTQTLKNLDFLIPLDRLKELHFMLGGTKNLKALSQIGRIEKLSFTRVRKLLIEDLLPINEMKFLKKLTFDTQAHLTDLNWLKNKNIKTEVIDCKNYKE